MSTDIPTKRRRPLRVLYVLDGYTDPNAGTEIQFWLLLRSLDRSRFEPAVLLLRESSFLRENLQDVPLKTLNITRLRSLRALWRIVCAAIDARRGGIDVAHLYFNDVSLVFPLLFRLLGIPTIVSRRDLGFWYEPGSLKLLRFNARFVTAVVANCDAVRRAVTKAEGFRENQVLVIYNGIARSREGTVDPQTRVRLAIPAEAPVIVLVANLRPLKRVADAVQALHLIAKSATTAYLVIAGEDREGERGPSYRRELEELAEGLGVLERVRFAGKVLDPMPLLAAADVCVLCSETEGLSNVVIEYMQAGKPAVCTNVGGNSELVVDGETGYLVPVGEPARLATAVADLLSDREKARTFGAAARRRAEELFAPGRMVEQHESLYLTVCSSG